MRLNNFKDVYGEKLLTKDVIMIKINGKKKKCNKGKKKQAAANYEGQTEKGNERDNGCG